MTTYPIEPTRKIRRPGPERPQRPIIELPVVLDELDEVEARTRSMLAPELFNRLRGLAQAADPDLRANLWDTLNELNGSIGCLEALSTEE
jgi:hypothetical protein